QPGHREAADRVEVLRVAGAGDGVVLEGDGLAAQVGLRDFHDVVAAIAILRPRGIVGGLAQRARLHRLREVVDLRAGVVVVVLAPDAPAVGVEHARDAVADHRGAAVADVQRPGRVGGHVLDAGYAALAGVVAAVVRALREDGAQLALPGAFGQPEVEEARAGDLDRGDRVARRQRRDQRLRQRARVRLRRPGQQHRGIAGEVAVAAVLGTLDHELRDLQAGRQRAVSAQGLDALADEVADQGAKGGIHRGIRRVQRLPIVRDGAQTHPRAARETGTPSPTTKWSSRRMSTSASACFRRAVTARSAALGSALPLGWLWTTMTAAALCTSARRTTSRGFTSAPSTVPRNSSSKPS